MYGIKIMDLEVRHAGLQTLTLPLINCVTRGKSLNLLQTQFFFFRI